jgi:hypothetical protein
VEDFIVRSPFGVSNDYAIIIPHIFVKANKNFGKLKKISTFLTRFPAKRRRLKTMKFQVTQKSLLQKITGKGGVLPQAAENQNF